MKLRSNRSVAFTVDGDGVLFRGVQQALTSFGELVRRDDGLTTKRTPVVSTFVSAYQRLQPINMRSVEALLRFRELASEQGADVRLSVLSDRGAHHRHIIERRMRAAGIREHFDDVLLNDGSAPHSEWKRSVVETMVGDGAAVVHFDDDIRRALSVASVDPDMVLAYTLMNPSNRPRMLRLSGLTDLPPNLLLVNGLNGALRHFESTFV